MALTALVAMGSGCGGGGDDDESLTKAEFVKQGSAVCDEGLKQIAKDLEAMQKREGAGRQSGPNELVEEVMIPNFRTEVEELRSLSAPDGDEDQVETFLSTLEEGIDEAEEAPEDFLTTGDSQIIKGKLLAERYGLEGCARLF